MPNTLVHERFVRSRWALSQTRQAREAMNLLWAGEFVGFVAVPRLRDGACHRLPTVDSTRSPRMPAKPTVGYAHAQPLELRGRRTTRTARPL